MIPDRYTDDEPTFRERMASAIANAFEKFALIGRALVWPIEQFFALLGYLFFRGVEATETSESVVSRLLFLIGAPLRATAFVSTWLIAKLHLDPILKPIVWVGSWIIWILLYPIAVCFGFLTIFLGTRSKRLGLLALPIIALVAIVAYVLYSVRFQDKPEITARYQKALDHALDQQDFATAGLYQQKLQQLGASVDQFDLRKAEELVKRGEIEEALQLVGRLAPADKLGLPAAHFWLAVHFLGQADFDQSKFKQSIEERCKLALQHLDRLKEGKIESIETTLLRALAYSVLGQVDSAKEALLPTRDQSIASAMLRFQLSLQSKDAAAAADDARAISRLMRNNKQLQSSVDAKTMQLWFVAEMMQRNNLELEKAAEIWYGRFPEDNGAKNSLVALRLAKFDRRFAVASTLEFSEIASLFIETAKLQGDKLTDPFKIRILNLFQQAKAGDRKTAELLKRLQDVEFNAGLAEFFGTAAASVQNFAEARKYLERAVELNDSYQVAWNNLAYVLDKGFPDESDKAIAAASKAIEINPNDVHSRDTRASILIRLNRYDEAKQDIEVILKIDPKFENAKKLQETIDLMKRS